MEHTQCLRHAHHGRDRWWASHKFGEALQVLCDCSQRELELRAARSSQAQSAEPQNALEVREQHLDLFTIAARPRERFGLGEGAGATSVSAITIFFVTCLNALSRRVLGLALSVVKALRWTPA